jgi:PAS domain S-box-containing protein
MRESIIGGLLQNAAILLSLSYVYDYWWNRNDEPRNILNKIVTGFVIGIFGIVLMLTPWILSPGLTFDTRSVVLSISGLFFGKLPTAIAMLITGLFRLSRGGDGVWMGIAVIVSSGLIGMIWNRFFPIEKSKHYILKLVALGYLVHIIMLGCTLFLPADQILSTLRTIAVPNLTIYPAVTVLLGILMFKQYKSWLNRNASEQLRESERRFSKMMQNTLLLTAITDTEGNLIFFNKSVIDTTGYSSEELTDKNIVEHFIPGYLKQEAKLFLERILSGDESALNFETEIIDKNGSTIIVSINCTLLRDESGTITGISAIGENITERKQAEADLINARIKAEESDKLKSIFLANMSHEIRTPMNAIMGFSTLLGEEIIAEPERTRYIEIIRNSSNRLLQLINDIIDISKIEARQLKILNEKCSLYDIVINSIETFRKSAVLSNKPEIELILKYPKELKNTKFISDGLRVQQVLDNLIGNAIKYTEKGVIETGCSLTSSDNENFIEIYVKDTGIGIPEEMHQLIFERFRQVEEGRFHEGTGLGLSISKGITDLLGGRIWLKSNPDSGTTFYFTIPYVEAETESEVTAKQSVTLPSLNGKRIIIAEDDYNSFRYLQLLFKGMNAEIYHAENGKVLLDMVKENTPDMILLDINMPVMSGFEFLEEIQHINLKTKIIAQTAYAMQDEKESCLNSGCDGYISKPIKKRELFDIINQVLSSNN